MDNYAEVFERVVRVWQACQRKVGGRKAHWELNHRATTKKRVRWSWDPGSATFHHAGTGTRVVPKRSMATSDIYADVQASMVSTRASLATAPGPMEAEVILGAMYRVLNEDIFGPMFDIFSAVL